MEVKIGAIYKHFKGDMYKVLSIAIHTETNERLVIYQAMYGEKIVFARPYSMFIERVSPNQRRFEIGRAHV